MKLKEITAKTFLKKLKDPKRDEIISIVAAIRKDLKKIGAVMKKVRYLKTDKGRVVEIDVWSTSGLGMPDNFDRYVEEVFSNHVGFKNKGFTDIETSTNPYTGNPYNPLNAKIWFY